MRSEYGTDGKVKSGIGKMYKKENDHTGLGGAESGCMPTGRKRPDNSGDQVKPWKYDGEK